MTHPGKKEKRNGLKTASLKRPLIVKCRPKTLIYISGVEEQYSNTGELFVFLTLEKLMTLSTLQRLSDKVDKDLPLR